MANPFRWLYDAAKGVYERWRGTSRVRTVRDPGIFAERYQAQGAQAIVDELMRDLQGGMTTGSWMLKAREQMRGFWLGAFESGRGGKNTMTRSDWGQLGAMLKDQYKYLNNFAEEIRKGELSTEGKLRLGQIRTRLQMYFNGSNKAFNRGAGNAFGVPRDKLPGEPGNSGAPCLTNCGCRWDFEEDEEAYYCFWRLGATEHCEVCVQHSQEWNPFIIRKEPPQPTPSAQIMELEASRAEGMR